MSYHGDTLGSVGVGGIELFHSRFEPLLFECFQATPGDEHDLQFLLDEHAGEIAAVIVEPLVQGAAGMLLQPPGYLRAVREMCDDAGVFLICDEVATGVRAHRHDVRVRAGGRHARTSCASPRG